MNYRFKYADALAACPSLLSVDQARFLTSLAIGAANNGVVRMICGGVVNGDYDGMKFSVANAAKDAGYYNNMISGSTNSFMLVPVVHSILRRDVPCVMVQAHRKRPAA